MLPYWQLKKWYTNPRSLNAVPDDANVFLPMVEGLRNLAHDVFDLKEKGLENLSDPEVFQLAQRERRILVTMDKDFSNILHYPQVSITASLYLNFIV